MQTFEFTTGDHSCQFWVRVPAESEEEAFEIFQETLLSMAEEIKAEKENSHD